MDTKLFRAQLASDGFAAWSKFLNAAELAEVRLRLDHFIAQIVPAMPPEHKFYEDKADGRTLKQLQNLGHYDHWFHELYAGGQFRELAEAVLDGPVIPKNLQFFSKPAGVGQPTPPHQDGYYFMLTPCEAITMWLALDDVDEENGCVRYVRGSHKRGMREHSRTTTLGFSQGIVNFPGELDAENEMAAPAQAGDLLVHEAMTIHRADGNHSKDRPRRALGFVYYSERAKVDTQAHAAYQKMLQSDMKATGRI